MRLFPDPRVKLILAKLTLIPLVLCGVIVVVAGIVHRMEN